ncbi:MAG: aminoacyl-tRNA hydrolase [Hyphomicrobiales bacterium]
MKLLAGLGNPGGEYARHRHNVGFMVADAIASAHGFGAWRSRFQGQVCEGRLGGESCLLLKPMTYMNESGRAVGEAMRFYKLGPGDVTVFYDELDLAPGKLRVKTGGGAAGHNGIRSIASHIGESFRRVRIGIGHPGDRSLVHGYVLHDFPKADREWLDPLLDAVAAAAPLIAKGDEANFMNEIARRMQRDCTDADTRAPAPGKAPKPRKPAAAERHETQEISGGAFEQLRKWLTGRPGD